MPLTAAALEFLGALERSEVALLGWGVTDGFFLESELEARAEQFTASQAVDVVTPWDLVQELIDAQLLWQLPGSTATPRYRSRFAEGVRLLARLRQIFSPAPNAWRSASPLVGDYRLQLRARTYPRRDIAAVDVLTVLEATNSVHAVEKRVLRALLRVDNGGGGWSISGFQVRSLRRVLQWASAPIRPAGTVVCAGTGSGKTLAFYLPAYMALSSRISTEAWTKCLALYPRKELLKDQLREALANARRCAAAIAGGHGRSLTLGALYEDVPRRAKDFFDPDPNRQPKWPRRSVSGSTAFECPFVRCPECSASMVWEERRVRAGDETLVCPAPSCGTQVGSDTLRLTRDRLLESPPDILFTTTEMLNQRMSSAGYSRLFGIGLRAERRPFFVLLDEVHTYEGTHGAHVALLLRRWRALSDARPHFVGLSATLGEAPAFFADLTGITRGDVVEVSPRADEMEAEGLEYMALLRGDSASGTSLLSTTIQTAMLVRRLIAPARRQAHYGSRVFAFTDNLDVTNRLFHDLRDAEGWDPFSAPSAPRPNAQRPWGSLATIRSSTLPDARERLSVGQNWAMVEAFGHPLNAGSRSAVGRTSSQDAGVDPNADVVVATSALEVGFDDPDVGAVIQHKAPLSAAAFLQRKGRAGRRRDMRPWTVVVLSDYGRDRTAYQAYERLFSPDLPPRRIPLGNHAVLRMQATYALLDWLAGEGGAAPSNVWAEFAGPATVSNGGNPQRQGRHARALIAVLEDSKKREQFSDFIQRALDIDDSTLRTVLWDPPRALLTEVVPTLLRRLERNWVRADGGGDEHFTPYAPLPEFMPRSLFADLQLPELEVRLPAQGRTPARPEFMSVAQALREFAPGRVSRRFGIRHARQQYWSDPGAGPQLSIDRACGAADREELGRFAYVAEDGTRTELAVFRPHALNVAVPPGDVRPSSNAFLTWKTEIVAPDAGHELDRPESSAWARLIDAPRFYTHTIGNPVEVRRFAIGCRSSVGRGRAPTTERDIRFVVPDADSVLVPAALGFVADVDAIRLSFQYPSDLWRRCANVPVLARALVVARFYELVRTSRRLDGLLNGFQRELVAQAYLAATIATALRSGRTLWEADADVAAGVAPAAVTDVLAMLMQWRGDGHGDSNGDDDDDGEDDAANQSGNGPSLIQPRRLNEIAALLRDPTVTSELRRLAEVFRSPIDATYEDWLRTRFKVTLASVFIAAAHEVCPRMAPGTLLADVEAQPSFVPQSPDRDELWISESTLGGGGFIDELLGLYAEDPRRFLRVVDGILGPSEAEIIADQLDGALRLLCDARHGSVRDAVRALREATLHDALLSAVGELRRVLSEVGIPPSPSLLVSLNSRLLREGTSEATDRLFGVLVQEWSAAEDRLGVEIDSRTFALALARDTRLDEVMPGVPGGLDAQSLATWRYSAIASVLWSRGSALRRETIRHYHPFASLSECDRLLVVVALDQPPRVALEVDWFPLLAAALIRSGTAELAGSTSDPVAFASAIRRVASEPIDADVVLVHARVIGVSRVGDLLVATFELPEAAQ
jgi:hypothetical protein